LRNGRVARYTAALDQNGASPYNSRFQASNVIFIHPLGFQAVIPATQKESLESASLEIIARDDQFSTSFERQAVLSAKRISCLRSFFAEARFASARQIVDARMNDAAIVAGA
jgi:hypothetical protein